MDPWNGDGCPDASPEKRKDPSDLYGVSIKTARVEVSHVLTT